MIGRLKYVKNHTDILDKLLFEIETDKDGGKDPLYIYKQWYSKHLPHNKKSNYKKSNSFFQEVEQPPLFGKKILIQTHFDHASLIYIIPFVEAGAQVELYLPSKDERKGEFLNFDDIKKRKEYIEPLLENLCALGIKSHKSIKYCEESQAIKQFAIILDTAGIMLQKDISSKIKPTDFYLEYTHYDKTLIKNISVPIIDINDSRTKCTETKVGTSLGFLEALLVYLKNDLIKNCGKNYGLDNLNKYINKYQSLHYTIIGGGGQVGKGIVDILEKFGVEKSNITIVEVDDKLIAELRKQGFNVIDSKNNSDKLRQHVNNKTNLICSAAGKEKVWEQIFKDVTIPDKTILVNMSTTDDIGSKKHKKDGKPHPGLQNGGNMWNFSLPRPTKYSTLSPTFLAIVHVAILMSKKKIDYNNNAKIIPLKNFRDIDQIFIALWQQYDKLYNKKNAYKFQRQIFFEMYNDECTFEATCRKTIKNKSWQDWLDKLFKSIHAITDHNIKGPDVPLKPERENVEEFEDVEERTRLLPKHENNKVPDIPLIPERKDDFKGHKL